VYRSALQIKLEQGRQVVGLFAPAGADFATPGVLSWSVDGGAELELVDLTHPWPTDFDGALTIHGKPRDGEAITLLDARVRSKTFRDQTFLVGGRTLALGACVARDDRWPRAIFQPSTLHEWLPDTGLSVQRPDDTMSRLVVEWNAPETRRVIVPGGEVTLSPGVEAPRSYSLGMSMPMVLALPVIGASGAKRKNRRVRTLLRRRLGPATPPGTPGGGASALGAWQC
jgi:hypothetical protein